ncbi:MAG TPA: polyprenyl synthetase [Firmicutes bacterium]|nr:polyprenyl synthetase [Bacillota bacterium]
MGYLAKFGYDEDYFNELLVSVVDSDSIFEHNLEMKQALLDIISNGGKRIRPLFLLLAADLGENCCAFDKYMAAVGIELMHISSLIHDDIIDRAKTRRNTQTLHVIYDELTALRLGNYTLHKSLSLLSGIKVSQVHLDLANTMKQLCIGEFSQQREEFNFNLSVEDYIEKSFQKTGTLIATSLRIGGYLANVDENTLSHLQEIGYHIGVAYQLLDDILDFTSDSSTLGKPSGNDLRKGIVTIPTIYALEDDLLKNEVLMLNFDVSDSHFDRVCDKIKNSDYIQKSHALSQHYTEQAMRYISLLPGGQQRFFTLVSAMLQRNH